LPSYIVDANFIITLNEIDRLFSLLDLKEVIIPRIVCREVKILGGKSEFKNSDLKNNFENFLKKHQSLSLVDATDNEKSEFVQKIAERVRCEFLAELEDQIGKIQVPNGWKRLNYVFLRPSFIPLENIVTNSSIKENERITKSEQFLVLQHADVHICALANKMTDSFILSMDACIWKSLIVIDNNAVNRIITIYNFLSLIHKDDPIGFIKSLKKVIVRRQKFAKNIIGSLASTVVFVELEKSVHKVLTQPIIEIIDEIKWREERRTFFPKLLSVKRKTLNLIKYNSPTDISFNPDEFLRELGDIEAEFTKVINLIKGKQKE